MFKVVYHGYLRQLTGKKEESFTLSAQSTLRDLLDVIQKQYGTMVTHLLRTSDSHLLEGDAVISIDGTITSDVNMALPEEGEVQIAIIPVIEGGK